MSKQAVKEKEILLAQLRKYTPELWPFFNNEATLAEHSENLYNFKALEIHLKRQQLVKKVVRGKLVKLFGEDFNQELNLNFDQPWAISITDHHQVLNHPYLVASNVISNVGKLLQSKKPAAILAFSSDSVPPNNWLSQNGFQFQDKRVPLFSNKERELTSYYLPQRKFNFIERLKIAKRWSEFNNREKDFLLKEQEQFFSFDYSHCQDYSDQITIIVKNTWPRLFAQEIRDTIPDLIYLTQEEVTAECLKELLKGNNFISQCLFDKNIRQQVLENFRGLAITWREDENKGTHFFWRKHPEQNKSLRLYLDGDNLVPVDERYKDLAFPLREDVLVDLLEKKEIYPSLFLIFATLNFYSGIKPLSGYGSVVYLDFMKKAWLKTLKKSDFKSDIELLRTIETDGFTAGIGLFFARQQGMLKAQYANDIYYSGGITADYLKEVFRMKLKDLMTIATPDAYLYACSKYIPPQKHLPIKITLNDLAEEYFSWVK